MSPDAIGKWNAKPTRRRGGQLKYSDLAIETALTLRLLFRLPLRQVEGFLRSLFDLTALALDVPDHTTLSRRRKKLKVPLRVPQKLSRIDLVIDSSGLAIFGEGEWGAVKHGGNGIRGWKKLHLGVAGDGVIGWLGNRSVDGVLAGCDVELAGSGRSEPHFECPMPKRSLRPLSGPPVRKQQVNNRVVWALGLALLSIAFFAWSVADTSPPGITVSPGAETKAEHSGGNQPEVVRHEPPLRPGGLAVLVVFAGSEEAVATGTLTCWRRPSGQMIPSAAVGDGVYRLHPPGDWERLHIRVEGDAFCTVDRQILLEQATDQIVIRVHAKVALSLVVANARTRVGVGNVEVRLWESATDSNASNPRREDVAVSGEDGVALFASLRPGNYEVRIAGERYRLVSPSMVSVDVVVGRVEVLIVEGDEWDIHGRVVAAVSGAGVPGVTLTARGQVLATSNNDGFFVVPGAKRAVVSPGAFRVSAAPPPDSGLSENPSCVPIPWGDRSAVIELLPGEHVLVVTGASGLPLDGPVSFRRGTVLGRRAEQEWSQLERVGVGRFQCPWDKDWEVGVWLRRDSERPVDGPRHAMFTQLATSLDNGVVFHQWVVHEPQEFAVVVVDDRGRAVQGCRVEAVFLAGIGSAVNAKAIDDYDPAVANPMFANFAQLLDDGVTNSEGRVRLRCARARGVSLRLQHPHFLDRVEPVSDSALVRIELEPAGSIRGVISNYTGARVSLVGQDMTRRRYPGVRVLKGEFRASKVPVGTTSVMIATPGSGNRPHYMLGQVEVVAGKTAELHADSGRWSLFKAWFEGDGLSLGDELKIIDMYLGYTVASTSVSEPGVATVALTAGVYRVIRSRRAVDYGNARIESWANGELTVRRDQPHIQVKFPAGSLRVQLTKNGRPLASQWLQVEGLSQVYRSGEMGWVFMAQRPGSAFVLKSVSPMPGGWQPAGDTWSVVGDLEGQSISAR